MLYNITREITRGHQEVRMTKKGKNGDKLQYGETLCVVHLIHYGFL